LATFSALWDGRPELRSSSLEGAVVGAFVGLTGAQWTTDSAVNVERSGPDGNRVTEVPLTLTGASMGTFTAPDIAPGLYSIRLNFRAAGLVSNDPIFRMGG